MSEEKQRREIDLHRRVCVMEEDLIDIRPARSAAIAPLIGFMLGVLAFVAVVFWVESLPFALTLALMGAAILLVPISGMGFVYSIYGANVIIDRTKQTAVWQQGWMGMGVGTQELVPFAKIERLEIVEVSEAPPSGELPEILQYEVLVLKVSGRKLSLGQVNVPAYLASDGLARAREVGQAVADLVGKPLHVAPDEQRPKRPRRRMRRRTPADV